MIIMCFFREKINSKGFVRLSFAAFSMGKCEWFEIIISVFFFAFEFQLYGDWAPHKTDFIVENAI